MLLSLLLLACAPDPMPLPAESAAEALVDREALPPLYRRLYDYAFLPDVQAEEQRVRLLIWLKYMDFNRYQLGLLDELAAQVARERAQVEEAQAELVARHEPAVRQVYAELWEALNRGAPEDELAKIGERLDAVRLREADLLALRSRSVRTVFELEAPFLRTLTPKQEALFADATFLLRHRLDPYANPGDFNALIGSIYYAGEFGVLSRSTFDPNEDHLDIGGLWSEEGGAAEQARFPDARREVVLYMVLLEPSLPEAVDAAIALRQATGVAETSAPGLAAGGAADSDGRAVAGGAAAGGTAAGGAAGTGVAGAGAPGSPGAPGPGAPAAGVPTPPAPGVPTAPTPAPPGAGSVPAKGPPGTPTPAPAGAPGPGTPTPPKPGVPKPPAPGKPGEPPAR